MQPRIGCTGWSYKDWYNGFYDRKKEERFKAEHPEKVYALSRYSEFFDVTEINSFNYTIVLDDKALDGLEVPHKAKWWLSKQLERHRSQDRWSMFRGISSMAERWDVSTPQGFMFTSKVPGMITHAKCLQDCSKETELFLEGMKPLRNKLGYLLYEFPSYFDRTRFSDFQNYFDEMPKNHRYVVEFRSADWHDEEVYDYCREKGITVAMSEVQNKGVESLREVSGVGDVAYVRLIGKHGVFEKFDAMKLSGEHKKVLGYWAEMIKRSKKLALVFVNNNFAGNAPETAKYLRDVLGIGTKEWKDPGLSRFF